MENINFSDISNAEIKTYNIQTAVNSINKCFNNLPDLIEIISETTKNDYITTELKQYNEILIMHNDIIYGYSKEIIKSLESLKKDYQTQEHGT